MLSAPHDTTSANAAIPAQSRNVQPWEETSRPEGIVPRARRPKVPTTEADQELATESSPRPMKSLGEISGTALFSVKQRYFGYVSSVHQDYVEVQLTDEKTGEYADAEIPKDMIKLEDHELLQEGLEFVWIFGYESSAYLKQSAILYIPRFRRITEEALAAERARVDAMMDTIFGALNPDKE